MRARFVLTMTILSFIFSLATVWTLAIPFWISFIVFILCVSYIQDNKERMIRELDEDEL